MNADVRPHIEFFLLVGGIIIFALSWCGLYIFLEWLGARRRCRLCGSSAHQEEGCWKR